MMKEQWKKVADKLPEAVLIGIALGFTTSTLSAEACWHGKSVLSTELHHALCRYAILDPK